MAENETNPLSNSDEIKIQQRKLGYKRLKSHNYYKCGKKLIDTKHKTKSRQEFLLK